jgi:predicted transposase/invertase (TIGR01784 family)
LNDWLRFFQAREKEDFEMLAQTNPAIAEAWGVVKRLSADESARMIAEAREKGRRDVASMEYSARKEGRQEGLVEGRQEGLVEGKWEVARNALRKKMAHEDIAELTGLDLKEIRQLATGLMQ